MFKPIKILFILSIFSTYLYSFSYTIEISQKELQEKIDKKFPIEKKRLFFTTIISDPNVILKDELNKIKMAFDLRLVVTKELQFKTSAVLFGTLLYKPEEKSIYFKDLILEELDLKEIPLEFHSVIKNSVQEAITRYINVKPIYKIEDKNTTSSKLLEVFVKDIKIENKTIYIKLSI